MNMVPVSSSNIAAVGWEAGVLQVEFLSGQAWKYQGVPRETYQRMLTAPSVGSFFTANIRDVYRAEEI